MCPLRGQSLEARLAAQRSVEPTRGGMKSSELHRLLRSQLGDWFRSNGFRRASHTQSGWYRGLNLVWFECDKRGWDQYAGSGLFVNFEAQLKQASPTWSGEVKRLQEFLTAEELKAAWEMQNRVISKLKAPPAEYIAMFRAHCASYPDAELMEEGLLRQFKQVEQPYRNNQDFTLRYFDEHDVGQWCKFLLGALPRISEELKK